MLRHSDRYDAGQRARFVRPDAARWLRSDIARFLKPGSTAADIGYAGREKKYNRDQPRVAAGNGRESGRWTDGAITIPSSVDDDQLWLDASRDPSATSDPGDSSNMFDVDPNAIGGPDDQLAQNRTGRGGNSVTINGQSFELSPGQAARLSVAEANANDAVARIQEIDPRWKPPESFYQSPEGLIQSYQATSDAAQARANELAARGAMPGPFAGASLPARSPDRNFTAAERREINRIGNETGCHTCGSLDPKTSSGNFVADHQIPTSLNPEGRIQRLFPQCLTCSNKQGPFVRDLKR